MSDHLITMDVGERFLWRKTETGEKNPENDKILVDDAPGIDR